MDDVKKIAEGLTEEQREAILTGTGTNWAIPLQTAALGLTDEHFTYTPLGLQVRNILKGE